MKKDHKVLYPIYKMNRYQFINYTDENKLEYTGYCEVLIDRDGSVILAIPSHTEAIINYIAKKEEKTNKEIKNAISGVCLPLEWCVDKYGIIAVWHNGYIYPTYKKITKRQSKTLKLLRKHKLINDTFNKPATEYGNFLKRKAKGIEDPSSDILAQRVNQLLEIGRKGIKNDRN